MFSATCGAGLLTSSWGAHLQDLGSLLLNLSRENLHPFLLLGDDRFKFGDGCLEVFALLRVTQRGIAAAHTAERNFRRMRLGLLDIQSC